MQANIKKKHCALTLLGMLTLVCAPNLRAAASAPRPNIITPANSIFAIDLHDVVVKPQWRTGWRTIRKDDRFGALVRRCFNPRFLYNLIWCFSRGIALAEQRLELMAQRYPTSERFASLLVAAANEQEPIDEVVALMEQLKNTGYRLTLFSNIGELTYFGNPDRKVEGFAQKFPQIDRLFSGRCVVCATNNFVHKPNRNAYECFLEQCNPDGKHVIFIDDRRDNVQAGERIGMSSIYLDPDGNPGQLRKQLGKLGIL